MKEKFFYVVSSENGETYTIKISDINILAAKALALEPEQKIAEAIGYVTALGTYYKSNEDELRDCYLQLTSSTDGVVFFCCVISLALIELEFREMGIHNSFVDAYNKVVASYQEELASNNKKHGNNGNNDDIEKAK